MSILGLILFLLGAGFSFFGTHFSDKRAQEKLTTAISEKNITIDEISSNNIKLIDQNATLLSATNEVSNTNKDLISQNTEMLTSVKLIMN
jgi:hypothetical protein